MATGHPRRVRKVLLRLVLVVGTGMIGLLLAEVAIRMFGWAPEVGVISRGRYRLSSNPKLIYEPTPGFRPPLRPRRRDFEFIDYLEGNRLGYRDREGRA